MKEQKNFFYIRVFTGGLAPCKEMIQHYLEETPCNCTIAADSGLDLCREYGFTPDLILGDFDSLSSRNLLSQYDSQIIKNFPQDKDYTDTELALHYAYKIATEKKLLPHITLIGGDGGRFDHLLSIYNTFSGRERPNVWFLKEQAVYFLQKGHTVKIRGLKENDYLSVARCASSNKGGWLTGQGLKWSCSIFNKKGMPSLSNRISEKVATSGQVTLTAHRKDFLVITSLSAQIHSTFSVVDMKDLK
jgi:thiamine pyrophosphokinase